MKRHYDYTLIDSRTGLSDVADICTLHLPDTLVDCFTLSDQGIDGAARVAALGPRPVPAARHPDPAGADAGRPGREGEGRGGPAAGHAAVRRAARGHDRGRTAALLGRGRGARTGRSTRTRRHWRPSATRPGSPTSLLAAFETLTGIITDGAVTALPLMDESVRERGKARFRRRTEAIDDQIVLRLRRRTPSGPSGWSGCSARPGCGWWSPRPPSGPRARPAAAHADSGLAGLRGDASGGLPDRDTEHRFHGARRVRRRPAPAGGVPRRQSSTNLVNVSAATAVERVCGWSAGRCRRRRTAGGREHPLSRHRAADLQRPQPERPVHRPGGRPGPAARAAAERGQRGGAAGRPAGHGRRRQDAGGPGVRAPFKAAYDVVWWIVADPPQFVDTALADLGRPPRHPRRADRARHGPVGAARCSAGVSRTSGGSSSSTTPRSSTRSSPSCPGPRARAADLAQPRLG